MSPEFDNNNHGACWPIEKALSVQAEIANRKFYGVLVRTGAASTTAPTHNLYLRSPDKPREVYCVAIFKNNREGLKLAGGEFTLNSGESFWVALFKNKSDNPKSPLIDLSFQPKEARAEQPPDSEEEESTGEWY